MTSKMFGSKSPNVLGIVSMKTQVSWLACSARSSRSTLPSASVFTVSTLRPAMAADAGLVPCAESGMSATLRCDSPDSSSAARAISSPAYSPCAPASGANPTPGSPVTSPSQTCSSCISFNAPCAVSSVCNGWISANPGNAAAWSFSFGLYFIVQDPSG